MSAVLAVLLFILKAIGILLATVLVLLLIALLIPVSLWVDYHDEALTLQVGALGLRYTVFPPKESSGKKKRKTQAAEKAAAVREAQPAQPKEAETARAAAQENADLKAETPKQSTTVSELEGKAAKDTAAAQKSDAAEQEGVEPQPDKKQLLGLTFNQLITAVRGVGTLGKAILCGIKVRHIRIYLPVSGNDSADTAIRYGRMQAWLHTGLGFLNRAMWLEFDECYLDADFMQEKQKKERFSCQISAQLLIMVIAVVRFVWLLWKANILDTLLNQFSGNEIK